MTKHKKKKRNDPAQKQHSEFQSERMWLFFFSSFFFIRRNFTWKTVLFYTNWYCFGEWNGCAVFCCVFFFSLRTYTKCEHDACTTNSIRFNGENLIFKHQSQVKILTIASKESEKFVCIVRQSWKKKFQTNKNQVKWIAIQSRNALQLWNCIQLLHTAGACIFFCFVIVLIQPQTEFPLSRRFVYI